MITATLHPDGSASFHVRPSPRLERIARAVRMLDHLCDDYGITAGQMLGRCRVRSVMEPRQVAMHLSRRRYRLSRDEAARMFQRPPWGVDHACEVVRDRLETEHAFAERYRRLERELDGIEDGDGETGPHATK